MKKTFLLLPLCFTALQLAAAAGPKLPVLLKGQLPAAPAMEISALLTPPDSGILHNKVICVDAGHGGTAATDHYRKGLHGEREEWINLRVALLLKEKLEAQGAKVILTRNTDIFVKLEDRAAMAVQQKADLLISIHHNATADTAVNFPIIYFHGAASENLAGAAFGRALATAFEKHFYRRSTPKSLLSDYVIFPSRGSSVLRNSYGIPGVLAEASFFTSPGEEQRLKQPAYNEAEAKAYLTGIQAFFTQKIREIKPEKMSLQIPSFPVLEEAQRTNSIARNWFADYTEGINLSKKNDTTSYRAAFELLKRSATSFPDSYVSAQCHEQMALLLKKMKQDDEAKTEELRTKEFFIPL
ncbi:N-acetylmuramoyl-L-alanine amidase family protein [Pedobacter hartonius]|uniref:N-acetylmuramoyl-L-alanine amidase n=1 Tax=Pedobacter hartonius TaxID=425514 RepID=A0A1H4G8D7_9SPHI|nr:N-acetylmuramoyl-L-alanine amidase [Pedobacter hartonius]SEB05913.1 N-acetylmuramoyl-L-alanine amidase [Pedobacter hartonius]